LRPNETTIRQGIDVQMADLSQSFVQHFYITGMLLTAALRRSGADLRQQ